MYCVRRVRSDLSPSSALGTNKSKTHAQYLKEKYDVELNDMSQPLVDAWSLRPSRQSSPFVQSSHSSSKHASTSSPLPSSPSLPPPPRSSTPRHASSRSHPSSKCDVSLLPETCVVLMQFPAHWGLQSLPAVQGLFAAFFLWTSGCSTLCEVYPEIQSQHDSDDTIPELSGEWPPVIWRASHLRWSWAFRVQQELSSLGITRLFESSPWHFYDAFTHASPAKFLALSQRVQRLEFLGDAVFTLASTLWMGISDPASLLLPATSFISLRSKLLSNHRLNATATVFGIHKLLRRRLEAREGADYGVSPKNVSDSVEAMLGAVWCSGGVNVALHVAVNMLVKMAGLANDIKLQKFAVTPDDVDSCDFVRELCRDVVATAAAAASESHLTPSLTLDSIVAMAKSHLSFSPISASSSSLSSAPSQSRSPPPSPPITAALCSSSQSVQPPPSSGFHFSPSSCDADRVLHMCTIDESCALSPTVQLPAGENGSVSDARMCSNVFLACLGKAVKDVVVSGHAFVMLGGAKPADLHSWVRVEVLRHERLVDLAEQHNIGPDVAFNSKDVLWNTVVATPFGKRSVGGSALCASVGCVWLLDVAGYNKLTSPSSASASALRRRDLMRCSDDTRGSGTGGGAPPGKG